MPLKTNQCLEACETSKAMNGVKKVLIEHLYIYQSIEAWGMWSFLEVSTSSTGSRMDPHSFIVCMRKVRETELEAATVCPAAVSNKS